MNIKENNRVEAQFPPINYMAGTQVIKSNSANNIHYMAWGMYHIIGFAKFDRENIQAKFDEVSNMMTHERYVEKKPSMDKFIAGIKSNKLKSEFTIYNDEWTSNVLDKKNEYGQEITQVNVEGEVKNKFGGYDDGRKKCNYWVQYFRKGGRTHVQDFGTSCF